MSKSVVEYAGRRVIYETPAPFAEVVARLEKELNKPAGGAGVFRVLGTSKTKDEIEAGVRALTNGRDFTYFTDITHHRWLRTYANSVEIPQAAVYTFGNPLIAQSMLLRDLATGLHIPPKLLLLENADGSGTRVIYDDPASIIPVPGEGGTAPDARVVAAAEDLSVKVEDLVKKIIGSE
ncbi:TT1751-like protein [Trametes elegans]|nr:TT1751-like protein [Trametes elegans]